MEEIKFNLQNTELTMPELLKAGYRREDITNLFETLQNKGFGTYHKGKRGKGCCARFEKNESCPNEFVIRGRRRYKRSEEKQAPAASESESNLSTRTKTLHSLWALSQNIVEDSTSGNIGYRCDVFADQILVMHRVRGGGESSIEKALQNVWSDVSDRLKLGMADVVSRLRGHGFCLLND